MNEQINFDQMDRMKILEMVENGRISPEEGASLLTALREPKTKQRNRRSKIDRERWFRVRVSDTVTGKNKATVNIPFGLMDWGLKIGSHFAPEVSDIDTDGLMEALQSGSGGKIVDVLDEECGEHVEIYVD